MKNILKPFDRKQTAKAALSILVICLGTFIMAIGAMAFLNPHNIVPGGFTGFAIVLSKVIPGFLPPGITALIMNIPLFLVAVKMKGKNFGFYSIIGTVSYSVFIDLIPLFGIDLSKVTGGNALLATIYGGICAGVGFGIVIRQGGSTGGSDTLANLVNKVKPQVTFGTILLFIDGFVVLSSGVAFSIKYGGIEHGVPPALYAFLVIFLSSQVADYVIEGKQRCRAYYIISGKPEELAKEILKRLGRGLTSLKARGMYTNDEREVLLCIVLKNQSTALKNIVFELDPRAFLFSDNVSEVFGEGFAKAESASEQEKKLIKIQAIEENPDIVHVAEENLDILHAVDKNSDLPSE